MSIEGFTFNRQKFVLQTLLGLLMRGREKENYSAKKTAFVKVGRFSLRFGSSFSPGEFARCHRLRLEKYTCSVDL